MTTILLPAYAYEPELPELLDRLGAGDAADEITMDFLPVTFWTPGALVLLLAKTQFWLGQNKRVVFHNCKESPAFRYFQRINFFSLCGLQMPEDFRRRDAGSRFVELRRVGRGGSASVEELSTDVAYCLFPDADVDDPEQSGLFDLLQYSVSELANNTIQHAKAPGFATAQYMARTDLIRVAIADTGIGVLRSFAENGSPFWKPGLTDAEAIALALQPKVSSKSHLTTAWGESINAGVGLTLLKEFCSLAGGCFFMASGNGVCFQLAGDNSLRQTSLQGSFCGTVCALSFTRAKIQNFPELLHKAKQSVSLLPAGEEFGKYFT
jgi:anti-sigma regulatory factor (Ser/Thr protein kinase)